MGAASNPQSTLALLILKTLERGPNHGFGITLHIQNVSEGALKVEEGSLYPALQRLRRDKLVTADWKESENGRRARYYKLTSAGRKALSAEKAKWDTLSRGVISVLNFV